MINPFSTNASLLYPLNKSENDVFSGHRSEALVGNGLISFILGFARLYELTHLLLTKPKYG